MSIQFYTETHTPGLPLHTLRHISFQTTSQNKLSETWHGGAYV